MENPFKVHLIYACTAIVLISAVMYVSLLPKVELPEAPFLQVDKLVHFSMYFILTLAFYKGFFNKKLLISIGFASLMSFFYGIIVEISQDLFTNNRMFDVFDIFANGIGALIAFLITKKHLLTKKI